MNLDHTDEGYKYATDEEKRRLDIIKDAKVLNSSLDILTFLHNLENEKQYLTVAEFKKYTPLFSKESYFKTLDKKGAAYLKEMSEEYYGKINPYKEVLVVTTKAEKKVVGVLPPAFLKSRPIDDSEQMNNPSLDEANRKIRLGAREDISQEGYNEYLNLLAKSAKSAEAITDFAKAKIATGELTKALDKQREEYYKSLYGNKTFKPNVDGTVSVKESSSKLNIHFDEDDEIFD